MASKQARKIQRKRRVRAQVIGSAQRPRLSVFRGSKTISLQLIDDRTGTTLASARDGELEASLLKKPKTERAKAVGTLLAQRAHAAGIVRVVFDRGGNRYHGRVSAAADGAREGGLEF
ncbi:MAG: 50S ribosomal protein L18 [Patescibacteria group bacterium]